MRVRRDVASLPHRSATETWNQIIDLITGPESTDRKQLEQAGAVMASIITEEHPSAKAIVLEGVGPQLRVYCRYGMKAIEDDRLEPLTWNPTAGDWTMHVPCDRENMAWVKAALAKLSPRILVFDVEKEDSGEDSARKRDDAVKINWDFRG